MRVLTYLLIAVNCAPPLYRRFLPMMDLPPYVASARMLVHLHDPVYGFATYYERAFDKSIACVPLFLLGVLLDVLPHEAATRFFVCASVAAYPFGLCVLLRALRKPPALALLGLPVLYACPFYLGMVSTSLSLGLALCAIAWLVAHAAASATSRARLVALCAVCCVLPFCDPAGVLAVAVYLACALATHRRSERPIPWRWVSPLCLGFAYWAVRAWHAEGVASFGYPNLTFRLLRLSQQVLGGFVGRGEAALLAAQVVLWLLLARQRAPWRPGTFRSLPHGERALCALVLLCGLGYLLLPSSTWSITAINVRVGAFGFCLLPALLPAANGGDLRERAPVLLCALSVWCAWSTGSALARFDAEAAPAAAVLAQVPPRSKLLGMIYDEGKVANSSPYLHFAAYALAQRGSYLSLTPADTSWTVPLRRRPAVGVPEPLFGSEWDPAIFHVRPLELAFHDAIVVRGKEPREMTVLMFLHYRAKLGSGDWLLYVRE